MVIAKNLTFLHYSKYLESLWFNMRPYDIQVSLFKAAIFGAIIAVVCSTIGLMTRGGAKDVGQSTTKAAVWTAIVILITDFVLTWLFFGTSFRQD